MKACVWILPVALICAAVPFAAQAQSYPVKTVRYIVPMSPGSGADTIARIVTGGMGTVFGQQVIVDNRTGAAGNIGAEAGAKAPPDGYTLFQASSTHAANVSLYRNLGYDLVRDFAAVTQLASSPSIAVVHPSLPVKSIAELVKLARAKPDAINYGSTGIGSATWVAGELFKSMAGVKLLHVPYRGGGEAATAVMSGEVSVYFGPLSVIFPQVKQGRLRGLAVTTSKRLAVAPELPTIAESGYPGYQSGNWYGIVAPAKTPREVVTAVRNAAVQAMADAGVNKRLADLGYVVVGDQPDEFGAFIKSEIATLAKIIQQTGAKAE
jgi:tripartite-type tricarboxylate transporter receptor subunit TctC